MSLDQNDFDMLEDSLSELTHIRESIHRVADELSELVKEIRQLRRAISEANSHGS